MNEFKNYWPRFKQELPVLLYFFIVQTSLNFNFPTFVKLGSPWNIVVPVFSSIVCAIMYTIVLLFPQNIARQINLEFLGDFHDPAFFKSIYRWSIVLLFHIICLFMWYIDYHRAPTMWYFIWYVHTVIAYILIYRVAKTYSNKIL